MAQRFPPTSTLRRAAALAPLLAALLAGSAPAEVTLTPTHAGLLRQSAGARAAGAVYLATDPQVRDAIRSGALATLAGNGDYYVDDDSRYAAARPEVKLFVERLAREYRATCGEPLVVTSLVRPRDHQPWNSDPLSVHPTGMAVDLRISRSRSCRHFLESTLLDLEARGAIEAAREHVVPHYHVVVFPQPYLDLLASSGVNVPGEAPAGAVYARLAGPDPFVVPALLGAQLAAMTPAEPIAATVPAVSRTAAEPELTRAVARSTTSAGSVARGKRSRHTTTRTRHAHAKTSAHTATRRYRVRDGETLWSIARRNGVTVAAIERANRVSAEHVKAGQVLVLPVK